MKRIVLVAALLLSFSITANAQMIGATNNQQTPRVESTDYSNLKNILRVEAGLPLAIAYNYKITPYIMLGGGGAYTLPVFTKNGGHPIVFGDLRFIAFKHLYLDIKAGCHFRYDCGLYGSVHVGFTHRNLSIGGGIGYLEKGDYEYNQYYSPGYGMVYDEWYEDIIFPYITISYDIPLKNK